MRPITVSNDFLQPPSFYLSKYHGLSAHEIANIQGQGDAVLSPPRSSPRKISIDPSIVAQWDNLMKRYKFKDAATMERMSKTESKSLRKCGSLVRVIFMMKLYQRLCNESGAKMNEICGEQMHEYLTRGFKEYSLIQLMNDCNHLTQYHEFGALKTMNDIQKRNKLETGMRGYFGHCDVMNCKIIQRILMRQDNNDNKEKMTCVEVERDIVDKYHRVFFHPLN